MQKPLYVVFILAAAMLVVGFWANPAPNPMPNAVAPPLAIGDMYQSTDMNALPIIELGNPI
jgi:hypothetical protein